MAFDHFNPEWVNKFETHSPEILNGWKFVNSYGTAIATRVFLGAGIRSVLYSKVDDNNLADLVSQVASTAIYASAELGFKLILEDKFDPIDILYAAGASAVAILLNKLVTRNH